MITQLTTSQLIKLVTFLISLQLLISGVRLCDLEPEQECSELAEPALIVYATC